VGATGAGVLVLWEENLLEGRQSGSKRSELEEENTSGGEKGERKEPGAQKAPSFRSGGARLWVLRA